MNEMHPKLKARAERKSAKRDGKKLEIAASAIKALQELGYANTSLRDIAAKSDMSLGMLHYYFEDRSDLIVFCVQKYKDDFVNNINDALTKAQGREAVIRAFSNALATSLVEDGMTHRLWYDIRNQAMFDETFRPVVRDIEAKLIGIVEKAFFQAHGRVPSDVKIPYALLDGAFLFLLQDQLTEATESFDALKDTFKGLLEQFL